jgi:hypothetical protein
MRPTSWRTTAAVLSVVAVPFLFFGILFIWTEIDELLGSREVSRYIRDHQSIVTRRLNNPKVHSFSLTDDPSEPGGLLIQFDVDDKATYEMLESDLNDIWGMRFPPQWKTTLRSKEELSNNYGYAGLGFRELFEGIERMMIAGIVSLAQMAFFIFLAVRRAFCSRAATQSKLTTGL